MTKGKQKETTLEEMAVEVSRLVDRGEATFDAIERISDKYKLDKKKKRDLEKRYLEIQRRE